MASSAVYPTPSMGSSPSWRWLGKPHIQEESYLEQLRKQKSTMQTSKYQLQKNISLSSSSDLQRQKLESKKLPRNERFDLQHIKSKLQLISGSSATEPLKRTFENISRTENSPNVARHKNNINDVSNTHEALKSLIRATNQQSNEKTSGPLTFGLSTQSNFDKGRKQDSLQAPSKANVESCQLSQQSSQKLSNLDTKMSLNKPKLPGRHSPKVVLCYLCLRHIKEEHFVEHLFFGPVKCSKCNQEVKNCHEYQVLIVSSNMGTTTCEHTLKYCSDPFVYVSSRLSGDSDDSAHNSLYTSNVLKQLSKYISNLNILEKRDPWKTAIIQCKNHLPSSDFNSSENAKVLPDLSPQPQKLKTSSTTDTSTLTPLHENNQRINEKRPHAPPNSEPRPTTSLLTKKQNRTSSHFNEEDDMGDLLLSQCYGLEQLEQAIEYVQVDAHCAAESPIKPKEIGLLLKPPKKKRGPRGPYKKRKTTKTPLKPATTEQENRVEQEELSTEYIETPANGYYYVVRHAIEECPMCYTTLCPSRFTVNVETFLMTTVCSECDLTIYIVHELPDGSTPGVSIVTEEGAKSQSQPTTKQEKKKRRYAKVGRPRKHKPWKVSDFYAK